MGKPVHGGRCQDKTINFYTNYIHKMNKYLVEFLGTLFVTFVVFATGNPLAIGVALALALLLGGKLVLGAFNPAITVALMYAGKLSQEDLVPCIVAQMAGALVGFELFRIGMDI